MSKALDKAKELAKKTNATVMVVNETTDDIYVVMSLDEYERLVERQETRDKRQETRDKQQKNVNDQVFTPSQFDESNVNGQVSNVNLAALTEEELLAKLNEQIREWRGAQVNREQIVLAEMPAEIKVAGSQGDKAGSYNLSGKVNFKVDNLEEEERFFLDSLD